MKRQTIKLNLARNCLRYFIKAYDIKEINVPYYICPTVLTAIRKENCRVKFYHIDQNFYPQKEFNKDEFILYPNYFGICSNQVLGLCKQYKNIIVDNAHNFYMPDCGLASFYSLRKFFNLKDGAILNISQVLDTNFETDSYQYKKFSSMTYNEMKANELRLNNEPIKLISKCTEVLFSDINIEKEKQSRLNKFYSLHDKYKNRNELKIHLDKYDIPFVYPYLTHDETEAENLEKEGYTILRYWNYLPKEFPEHIFYKYLIPIPLKLNLT